MAYTTVHINEPVITIGSDENDNSPTWNLTADGMTAQRIVKVAWPDVFEFCQQMVGGIEYTGGKFVYTLGHRWPYDKGTTKLRAVSARPRRFGGSSAAASHADGGKTKLTNHSHADVDINYVAARGDIFDLVEETFDPSMEYMTLSNRKLWWDAANGDDELKTDEAPGKIIHQQAWIYTIKNWPRPVDDMAFQGKTNSDEITSLLYTDKTFAPETLFFNPADMITSINHQGYFAARITYQILYKPVGWNKFPKGGELEPQKIYDKNGEAIVYAPVPFQPLFLRPA